MTKYSPLDNNKRFKIVANLSSEDQQYKLAIEMINLGARLQMLQFTTNLSREKLINLYKDLKGVSPPKGILPYSKSWFLTWQPNIYSSIFYNIYEFLVNYTDVNGIHAIVRAYKLYKQQIMQGDDGSEPVLSLTRAWVLVSLVESGVLTLQKCICCGGEYVVDGYDLSHHIYTCNLCHGPLRAGKTNKSKVLNYKLVKIID